MSFEKALGVLPESLNFRVERSRVLASNVANAETPNYAARDIEFAKAYRDAGHANSKMIIEPIKPIKMGDDDLNVQYRNPYQPAKDGNTVEVEMEQVRMAQNNTAFQTSLTFLKGRFGGLNKAVEGK